MAALLSFLQLIQDLPMITMYLEYARQRRNMIPWTSSWPLIQDPAEGEWTNERIRAGFQGPFSRLTGHWLLEMDRFVIRKEKKDVIQQQGSSSSKNLKQARLHQLKGVVVLEELQTANQQLCNPETSSDEKINILSKLKNRKPAKEILKSTGIGRTVHRLCRDPDPGISSLSKEIYDFWRTHVLHLLHRKPIEVESDAETQRGRCSAKKLINQGLENSMLAEEIEIHVFNKCKKIMNKTYSRMVRKIHFTFKSDEDQRRRVNEMNCDLKEFVDDVFKQVNKVYAQ